MRPKLLAAAALLAAALPIGGQAAVTEDNFLIRTTSDLVALCTADRGDPLMTAAVNFCHGFGVGVYQTLSEQEAGRQRGHLICPRGQTPSRNEAVAEFVTWAKAKPD